MSAPPTEYDTVAYPGALYAQTHPDRLATIATLFGLPPTPVERARVLELGCGDGTNLLAMAYGLPGSQFVGIDLAGEPIRRGRSAVDALGLTNLTLLHLDLLSTPPDLGTFDYIIAHGVYSWVPPVVREKILGLCRSHLSAAGIAYISYNAYPGNHLRDAVRHMMRFHVRQFAEPMDQVRQARTLVKWVAEAKAHPEHWQDIVRHQGDRIAKYVDAGLFHDDLSAINQPFYFDEFMEAASHHRLQFLGDAQFADGRAAGLTNEAEAVVRQIGCCNAIAREQYLDFLTGRSFRQDLLCHRERSLDHEVHPSRVFDLFAATDATPAKADADLTSTNLQDFNRGKAVVSVTDPVLKSAVSFLSSVWPRRVPFGELLEAARQRAGARGGPDGNSLEQDAANLGEFLVRAYGADFIDLHAHPGAFVAHVSERPEASRLARWQLGQTGGISSLRHQSLRIDDALGRGLLQLLDGTRDRAALVTDLAALVDSGGTPLYSDGRRVESPDDAHRVLATQLEPNLRSLARFGLLVA